MLKFCDYEFLLRFILSENEAEAIRAIENGIDADIPDQDGKLPMHLAALKGLN